jgi:YfiH family protein
MAFQESRSGGVVTLHSSVIPALHAFTTRDAGESAGVYASLNLGQNRGDDESAVRRNYALMGEALGFDASRMVFSRQVHGTEVRLSGREDLRAPFEAVPYEADGLLTRETDVPLIIFIADCVPILLCDPETGAVGAVHAGWRGTVQDIASRAVSKMAEEYGCRREDIRAAIGPCISQCCYETGGEVARAAEALMGPDAGRYIEPRGEKFMIDLKGINAQRLLAAGLRPENIDMSDECTACSSDKFWSHRVTKGIRGSQAALIMRKGTA